MKYLESPVTGLLRAPYCCFVCRRSPNEDQGIVDCETEFMPEVFTPYNGTLYLCESCAESAGRVCGLPSPQEWKDTQRALDEERLENKSLKEAVALLKVAAEVNLKGTLEDLRKKDLIVAKKVVK